MDAHRGFVEKETCDSVLIIRDVMKLKMELLL